MRHGDVRTKSRFVLVLGLLALWLVGPLAAFELVGWAQFPPPAQTSWEAAIDETEVHPGEVVMVRLNVAIDSGWHLYSMTTPPGGPTPTEIGLEERPEASAAGPALQPKPKTKYDENFQMDTEVYSGTVTFLVPIRIAETAPAGPLELRGNVNFQICDPKQCISGTVTWQVAVPVTPGAPSSDVSGRVPEGFVTGSEIVAIAEKDSPNESGTAAGIQEETTTAQGDSAAVEKARSEGLWAYLWLSINAGLISLLTPCVFPMIPITVSYFTKHDGKSRARGIADAGVYALAIIVTFTVLGVLTAILFGATGIQNFAANPWVNLLLAAIFIGLALNLFGFYEIFVPGSVLTPLSRVSERGGFLGTLLMGVTFTLTSFTCTVPLVGALLLSTAKGDWIWPIVGMLGYSTAFALPFFFLALFPRLLSSLPKAGGWMVSVKVVMGFLEVAAALKFISNVDLVWGFQFITREMFLAIWVAIAFLTAFYLLGKVRLPHERALESIGVFRMLFSGVFLSIAFYLFTGMLGLPLGELDAFLPPISSADRGGGVVARTMGLKQSEPVWLDDYDTAIVRARENGRPLFVDFTGFACTNCRWMEANVFPTRDVHSELERFELVQLYTDGQGEEYVRNRKLQEEKFGSVALPLYVVVDPVTEREIGRVEGLTRNPAEFADFLRRSRDAASIATVRP